MADLQLNQSENKNISISIDLGIKIAKTGDVFEFDSFVSYNGTDTSPRLIMAMNIINLQDGAPVDPEDWSPRRTQFISPMDFGETATKTWTVHAILKGDFMVYLVVMPVPAEKEDTTIPVSSSAIHLTVTPYTRLNPGGILPLAIGMPITLILSFKGLRSYRKNQIDLD
jgi:hypothetical protein